MRQATREWRQAVTTKPDKWDRYLCDVFLRSPSVSAGVYVKCLVMLGRTCVWGAPMQARFAAWCQRHGVQRDNSAMTAFLLRNGFNTIQNGKVVVVLSPG